MRAVAASGLGAALSGLAATGAAADGLLPRLDADLRTTSVATRNYDQPLLWGRDNDADGRTDLALRVIARGRPHPRLRWEAHAVGDLALTTSARAGAGLANLLGTAGGGEVPYRLTSARREWGDAGDVRASVHVDRAWLRVALESADITVGRQAVTFGKTWLWNPLDLFLPFGSTQFDRDYKPGVDAVRLDLPLGDLSGATLVGVPGRERSGTPPAGPGGAWDRSALVARVFGNTRGWDLAAQGGKVLGGYHLGGAFTGELASLQLRGEAAWFAALEESGAGAPAGSVVDSHLGGVAGVGRGFAVRDLQLQAEYFYNGAARGNLKERLALVAEGRLRHVFPPPARGPRQRPDPPPGQRVPRPAVGTGGRLPAGAARYRLVGRGRGGGGRRSGPGPRPAAHGKHRGRAAVPQRVRDLARLLLPRDQALFVGITQAEENIPCRVPMVAARSSSSSTAAAPTASSRRRRRPSTA